MTDADLGALRALAVDVANEAADLVRRRRREGVEVMASKTSEVDIVTQVDQESEELLRRRLADARPGDGFLGEEGARRASRTGVTWVVDPIDGTVNFLYGVPHYAVCVAAVDEDEETLAGAVVDVVSGRVYSAQRGGGATCDGTPLRVAGPAPMSQRLFVTGFSYDPDVRVLQGAAVTRLLPRVRDIRRLGSAALDLCRVAEGTVDAYVEEGLHLWDRAAAGLVATEAGASMTVTIGVGGLDCVICTGRHSFAETVELARECGFLAADDRGLE